MVLPRPLSESEVLQRVSVRLVLDFERPEFDRLLEEEHYVHQSALVGESLRYVLQLDGQWVALAAFSAASLHLKAREQWIGWSPRQRARRLGMVVNNSRFLVLPERQRYPNLASRALGLCLRRLSQDWQDRWGHPVWVVETFVDESRYRGTCPVREFIWPRSRLRPQRASRQTPVRRRNSIAQSPAHPGSTSPRNT